MKFTQVLPLFGLSGLATSAPVNASYHPTPGPCRDLIIPVTATANNTLLPTYPNSTSPTAFYEYIESFNLSALPQFTNTVSGTFNISASYCEPTVKVDGRNAIQLLVHGVAYTKSYWSGLGYPHEFAAQYSWVDHARSQGYATLAIDRLGNGESSHPDPLNVAQGPLQVEILHQLIQSLRNVTIPTINQTYNTVILGTHSYGSVLGRSLATLHPTTGADAYVLTSLVTNITGFTDALVSFQARAASQVNPFSFSSLPEGYVSFSSTSSIRSSLYAFPSDFSLAVLSYDQVLTHILVGGEVIAKAPLETSLSNFTGPVMVLTGRYDQIVCGVGNITQEVADCGVGAGSFPASQKVLFPKAREFKAYVTDKTGHNVNLHYSAGESFGVVHQWLEEVGF